MSGRAEILQAFGAGDDDLPALLTWTENVFQGCPTEVPLTDEPYVAVWREWVEEGERDGMFRMLARHLPQLAFPIAEGMSKADEYRAATLQGRPTSELDSATGLCLNLPERLRVVFQPTPAGAVPVIQPSGRDDFETLVRALAARNEPVPIVPSMGACTVTGYNDWERLRAYQCAWLTEHPGEDWNIEMARLQAHRVVYQDRFLIVSDGDYSAIPASRAGLDVATWRARSMEIRQRHECTHYTTLRLFGSARNRPHDELVCDFVGYSATLGRFSADLFLHGMGLEAFPAYRDSGRLRHYAPDLSLSAFTVLCAVVRAAAIALERFDAERPRSDDALLDEVAVVAALCGTSVTEMAAEGAVERLCNGYSETRASVRRVASEGA